MATVKMKVLTPTGLVTFKNNILAAVERVFSKKFVFSAEQPTNQEEGGIWFVLHE